MIACACPEDRQQARATFRCTIARMSGRGPATTASDDTSSSPQRLPRVAVRKCALSINKELLKRVAIIPTSTGRAPAKDSRAIGHQLVHEGQLGTSSHCQLPKFRNPFGPRPDARYQFGRLGTFALATRRWHICPGETGWTPQVVDVIAR
jgi:hypothetical protein